MASTPEERGFDAARLCTLDATLAELGIDDVSGLTSQRLVMVRRVNTDARGTAVSSAQFGKRVKLILETRK